MKSPVGSARAAWWRIPVRLLVVVALVLVAVRWVGSPIVTHWANKKLDELPKFHGHVEAVQLALWRGTVSVRRLTLVDREHPEDGPVVTVDHAMLSVAWAPLFKGRIGGHGDVEGARVLMVKQTAGKQDDAKEDKPVIREWQQVLQKAFPVEITRFEIKDSEVRFEDRSAERPAAMTVDQIQLTARDVSNRRKSDEAMPATVTLQARVGGSGRLMVDARADPSAAQPRFYVKMELKGLSLPEIHDFLVAYALIDVSAGQFEVFSEINAADGHYDGYLKPFFKDLKFRAVPDPNKTLLQRAAVKVASAVKNVLKNDEGNVATKAPFRGDFADNQVEVWTTVENLLRNAFVQALREGLEGQTPTPKEE